MTGLHKWEVGENEHGITIVESPSDTVCELIEGTKFERKTRAHLIAAAPDLRDALQQLAGAAALIDARQAAGLEISPALWRRVSQGAIEARNALRKAVGLLP